MSSFIRRIGKRIAKSKMTTEERAAHKDAKSQTFRQHEDGIGYDTYHPTRGWRTVNGRRVVAQFRMAQLLGGAA